MRVAVVDLGTNSTRLLVADVSADGVREVERRSAVTRLGEGVDASGRLETGAIERVHAAVAGYREAIDSLEAERVVAVATSAVRDAVNGREFLASLDERHGVPAREISGDEEARLTFLGATAGRPAPADGDGALLVIDIGGGSTEYVVGSAGSAPTFHVSTRAGSVRQSERHLVHDPPDPRELEALTEEVRGVVAAAVPEAVRSGVGAGIAVAGTATSLAAIDQLLEPYDPLRVHGYRLAVGACERRLAELAARPLELRRRTPGLHPDRAPTIVAGAAILLESMRLFGLPLVEVSEADLLHGAALEAVVPQG